MPFLEKLNCKCRLDEDFSCTNNLLRIKRSKIPSFSAISYDSFAVSPPNFMIWCTNFGQVLSCYRKNVEFNANKTGFPQWQLQPTTLKKKPVANGGKGSSREGKFSQGLLAIEVLQILTGPPSKTSSYQQLQFVLLIKCRELTHSRSHVQLRKFLCHHQQGDPTLAVARDPCFSPLHVIILRPTCSYPPLAATATRNAMEGKCGIHELPQCPSQFWYALAELVRLFFFSPN